MTVVRRTIAAYRVAYGGLPREVWMLSFGLFINRFGTMVLPFLAIYLTRQMHFTAGQAGQLLSVYGIGAVIGAFLSGHLTDRVGATRLQIFLLAASAPMFLVIPVCRTFGQLAIAMLCLSILSEGVRPANAAAIAQFTPRVDQTRAYGLQRMALNLGVSFGPAIGGFLTQVDFVWLFIGDALTTFACAVTLFAFFGLQRYPDANADTTAARDAEESATGPGDCQRETGRSGSNDDASELGRPRGPLRDYPFLAFLALMLGCSVVFFQVQSTYPLYLTDFYGFDEIGIGLIFGINTIMIVIFEMLLVQAIRGWSLLRAIGWGCFLTCVGFGILPFGSSVWFCVLSMIILTLGEMLSAPLASGWIAARSSNGMQGRYMGLYTMMYSFAFVIAPAIGGWLYEQDAVSVLGIRTAGPHLIWFASLALGVVILTGYYLLDHYERGGARLPSAAGRQSGANRA